MPTEAVNDEQQLVLAARPEPATVGHPTGITVSIDLDTQGKTIGHLISPWSRDESGWGNLLTPIAVIANGDGPTVLLVGGNHGDEFEGPVALRRLVAETEAADVSGRLIVLPGMNQAALKAGRRLSPIDGVNMNRAFPGDPAGSITERLADFVFTELVRRADIVVDLHSGGSSMIFEPFVATHELTDRARFAETLEYLQVFGTPLAVVMREPEPVGLLDTVVEQLGKVFLTTEIGGAASVSHRTTSIAHRGVVNVLRQAGVLCGAPELSRPSRLVRMTDDGTGLAPGGGLFEPRVECGDEVAAGDLTGLIHDLDDLSGPPHEVRARIDGLVIMRHGAGLIAAGDPVVAVAVPDEPQPDELQIEQSQADEPPPGDVPADPSPYPETRKGPNHEQQY